ncbi:MAG: glycosyltransferase family 2 protein [Ruminococcus sp.]|jgi:glycosyltransferase involved in cell wall biosynthesis
MIKVSVIVPAYNVAPYLEGCLRSLAEQTLTELEIIVIDDGSTDGTGETACRIQAEYPGKLIIKTTKNQGAARARNEGLALARGEYVGFVDGDDTVCPAMFERLYRMARQTQADIVCCGYLRVDGKDVQNRGTDTELCGLYGQSIYEKPEILTESTPYLWNKIFRRSMIEKRRIVFQDFRIYEDLVFTYQSFLYAKKIQYLPLPLYQYVVSREGALTSSFSRKRFDLFAAFDCLLDCYEKEGVRERFLDELFFILIKHVYVACEEHAKIKMWGEKFRYIRESFAYLRKVYPKMETYTRYYDAYGNKKSKYENKGYWYFRTVFPWIPEIRRKLGKLKRAACLGKSAGEGWNLLALPEWKEGEKASVLLFWDPALSPAAYDKLLELVQSLKREGVLCLYCYEKSRVLGRQEMIQKLADIIPCREQENPFSSLTKAQRILMALTEEFPWLNRLAGAKMSKMMKKEFQRIFPAENFSCAFVAGQVRPRSLALAKAGGLRIAGNAKNGDKSPEEMKRDILILVK